MVRFAVHSLCACVQRSFEMLSQRMWSSILPTFSSLLFSSRIVVSTGTLCSHWLQPQDVRLELTNDGLLVVMAGTQRLWSSTLTPLGKRLPPYR